MRATDDVAAIGRMFRAVEAIDAHIEDPPRHAFPFRGVIRCPNCGGKLAYVQLTPIKGAARCSSEDCVDFAPLAMVKDEEIAAVNRRLGLSC